MHFASQSQLAPSIATKGREKAQKARGPADLLYPRNNGILDLDF
jgi:hypothetical protein